MIRVRGGRVREQQCAARIPGRIGQALAQGRLIGEGFHSRNKRCLGQIPGQGDQGMGGLSRIGGAGDGQVVQLRAAGPEQRHRGDGLLHGGHLPELVQTGGRQGEVLDAGQLPETDRVVFQRGEKREIILRHARAGGNIKRRNPVIRKHRAEVVVEQAILGEQLHPYRFRIGTKRIDQGIAPVGRAEVDRFQVMGVHPDHLADDQACQQRHSEDGFRSRQPDQAHDQRGHGGCLAGDSHRGGNLRRAIPVRGQCRRQPG